MSTVQRLAFAALLRLALCTQAGRNASVLFKSSREVAASERRKYDAGSVILNVSGCLKAIAEKCLGGVSKRKKRSRRPSIEQCREPKTFDTVARLFERQLPDIDTSVDEIVAMLCLLEHPDICDGDGKAVSYGKLAKMARDVGGECPPDAKIYMLRLLRKYAGTHGIEVRVENSSATLCPVDWCPLQYGSADREEAIGKVKILESAMNKVMLQRGLYLLGWFAEAMEIHELDVAWCELGACAMKSIRSIKSLTRLDISHCRTEPGSIGHLQETENLEEMYVQHTRLNSDDLVGIGRMRRLRRLAMCGCITEPGSLRHVFEELSNLEVLDVSYKDLNKDDLLGIAGIRSLSKLDMRGCGVRPGDISCLQALGSLAELYVQHTKLNSDDLAGIGRMRGLTKLNVFDCGIELGVFKHLRELGSLRELSVSYNDLVWDDFSDAGKMRRLAKLEAKSCRMAPGGLRRLLGKLENIEELDVSCNYLTEDDFSEAGRMGTLAELNIRSCEIEPGSLRHLLGLESLRVLHAFGLGNTNSVDWDAICKLRLRGVSVTQL